MATIAIKGRPIGDQAPVYIVAEVSGNHRHDFDTAVSLVHAAKAAGADAVKLQTYTPDTLTIDSHQPWFHLGPGTLWAGRSLYELYGEAQTPWEWHAPLIGIAEGLGLHCFSTPFDESAVDFLETLQVPAYKVASFELVDHALVRRVARTGKPLILSTGMATLAEIEEAVRVARHSGANEIALLKCTSAYPAPPEEMNLRSIPHLAQAFGTPVGLSDHTLGIAVPVTAVALGARIVEKHITLRRADGGPDAAFSLEPDEFGAMVSALRAASAALGAVEYGTGIEQEKSRVFRRSLFVVERVRAGEVFTASNVRCIRPGYGLSPVHLERVLGQVAACDLDRGTPLEWRHLEGH